MSTGTQQLPLGDQKGYNTQTKRRTEPTKATFPRVGEAASAARIARQEVSTPSPEADAEALDSPKEAQPGADLIDGKPALAGSRGEQVEANTVEEIHGDIHAKRVMSERDATPADTEEVPAIEAEKGKFFLLLAGAFILLVLTAFMLRHKLFA